MRLRGCRRPDDAGERGAMLVAAIAVIALLFFGGTVMALAVSSNLHTVRQVANEDAVHYAAESAVARGMAASLAAPGDIPAGSCGQTQPAVNGVGITSITCYPLSQVKPDSVQQWAIPATPLPKSISMDLAPLGTTVSVWTVIGWRSQSPGTLRVALEGCPERTFVSPGAAYFSCSLSLRRGNPPVRLVVVGSGPIAVSPFVVRAAGSGKGSLVTIVGRAGSEAREADLLFEKEKHRIALWDSVLP